MGGSTLCVYDVFNVVGLHPERSCYQFRRSRLCVFFTDAVAQFFGQFGLRSVSCLLRRRSPATIFRAVRAVVVDPIKGQSNRLQCKVGYEVSDIMPTITDNDTAPAIARVFCVRRVITSLHHGVPCWVQRVLPQAVLRIGKCGLFDPLRSGFDYGRVAVFVPAQVVHSAQLSGEHGVIALRLGAGVHASSITDKRTYEKSKGVATK